MSKTHKNRILTLVQGGKEYPSSNYRHRQFYPYLKSQGFKIDEFNLSGLRPNQACKVFLLRGILRRLKLLHLAVNFNKKQLTKKLKRTDFVWVNKRLDTEILDLVNRSNKKVILDYDDAVFINNEDNFNKNLEAATKVVAGNNFLKSSVPDKYHSKIQIIPTLINVDDYPKPSTEKSSFVIGWMGSVFTNSYLKMIAEPLNKFLKNYDAELWIISDKMESLTSIFPEKTRFITWSMEDYKTVLSKIDVGIMPLEDNLWNKGKCSFKMLQYMAAEKPVIVSPYGMNAEVLELGNIGFGPTNKDEWYESFQKIYEDKTTTKQQGKNSKSIVNQHFNTKVYLRKIAELFS